MDLTVNGHRIFAATGGRPFDSALPAVVFVHGAGIDHTSWQLQTRYFAYHGYTVLAMDLPGHGRSEGPVLGSIEALADWLIRFLDSAQPARVAALVGHSMGSLVTLEAAAHMPERIDKLALIGAAVSMPVSADLLEPARAGEHLAHELVTSWAWGRRAHLGGHRGPGLWMLGGGLRLLEQGDSELLGTDLAAADAYAGGLAAAEKITCPTLLLCGGSDRMTPPDTAQGLAACLADARTVVIEEAGHMMMIEQPDRTLDALRDFI